MNHERKLDKLDLIKILNFYSSKDTIKKMKRQSRRACDMYLTKELYPESIKNGYNSLTRRQTTKFLNGQNI